MHACAAPLFRASKHHSDGPDASLTHAQGGAKQRTMITEIAEIDVKPGAEAAFEAGVAAAAPLFEAAKGCLSFALTRSIEHPSRYRLLVGWASVEDHTEGFRASPAFAQWRALVGPHFAAPPRVEHVAEVLKAF